MGNREALLAGARRCLEEKGYAATRARDVAGASGVSLAAIGYHFGTTQALLREVVFAGVAAWGADLDDALDAVDGDDPGAVWARVMSSFTPYRGVLAGSFEMLAEADRDPAVRQALADALRAARQGLAAALGSPSRDGRDDLGGDSADLFGAYYYALVSGLLTQWLVDPDALPTGEQFAAAMAAAVSPPQI